MTDQTNELTKSDVFKPTATMVVWIDTAIEIVSDSPTEIEAKCKENNTPITRQAFYTWRKLPGFEEWYIAEYKKRRSRWLPTLDRIGMKNAQKDYNYWKDMNKKAGEDLEEKSGVNINFNKLEVVGQDGEAIEIK